MKINKALDKILGFAEDYLCAALFFLMAAIIMIQIILRTSGLPLAWTEETARYLFVWIIYLAASKAVRNSKHLQVDLLSIALKGKASIVLKIVTNLVSMIFFWILIRYGTAVMNKMLLHPQYSPAVGYNMIIPYAAPFVGAIMMMIRSLQNIYENIIALGQPLPAAVREEKAAEEDEE